MEQPGCVRRTRVLGVCAVMLVAGCLHANSSGLPEPRRVHYVVIEDGVSNNAVRAHVGEEVRWVNVRQAPVSVEFNGLPSGKVSCGHGFSNSTNSHLAAVILPDDNASLCFAAAGRQTYRVLDASRPGVELNHEVTVEVVETR